MGRPEAEQSSLRGKNSAAPERLVSLPREARQSVSLKKGSHIFKQRAPNVTSLKLTAPRGEYAALRRQKSAFVFAVKSQSSPQFIESVLSLISGLEPRERKKLRHSA